MAWLLSKCLRIKRQSFLILRYFCMHIICKHSVTVVLIRIGFLLLRILDLLPSQSKVGKVVVNIRQHYSWRNRIRVVWCPCDCRPDTSSRCYQGQKYRCYSRLVCTNLPACAWHHLTIGRLQDARGQDEEFQRRTISCSSLVCTLPLRKVISSHKNHIYDRQLEYSS
jgi:hypothetical protein